MLGTDKHATLGRHPHGALAHFLPQITLCFMLCVSINTQRGCWRRPTGQRVGFRFQLCISGFVFTTNIWTLIPVPVHLPLMTYSPLQKSISHGVFYPSIVILILEFLNILLLLWVCFSIKSNILYVMCDTTSPDCPPAWQTPDVWGDEPNFWLSCATAFLKLPLKMFFCPVVIENAVSCSHGKNNT